MSFEMDQLSGDDSSSSSKFGSSDEEVHELLVVNSQVTGIQRYQFQPRRDSYDSEVTLRVGWRHGGRMSIGCGEESTFVRLGNLNWYVFVIL